MPKKLRARGSDPLPGLLYSFDFFDATLGVRERVECQEGDILVTVRIGGESAEIDADLCDRVRYAVCQARLVGPFDLQHGELGSFREVRGTSRIHLFFP